VEARIMAKCPKCGRTYLSTTQFEYCTYDGQELFVCPECIGKNKLERKTLKGKEEQIRNKTEERLQKIGTLSQPESELLLMILDENRMFRKSLIDIRNDVHTISMILMIFFILFIISIFITIIHP
jgi:hypothetical protein